MGGRNSDDGGRKNIELEYEEFVMAILQAGGTIEQAHARLDGVRRRLGLTLRTASEIEVGCIQSNKRTSAQVKTPPPPVSVKSQEDVTKSLQQKSTEPVKPDPKSFTIRGQFRPLAFTTGQAIDD